MKQLKRSLIAGFTLLTTSSGAMALDAPRMTPLELKALQQGAVRFMQGVEAGIEQAADQISYGTEQFAPDISGLPESFAGGVSYGYMCVLTTTNRLKDRGFWLDDALNGAVALCQQFVAGQRAALGIPQHRPRSF